MLLTVSQYILAAFCVYALYRLDIWVKAKPSRVHIVIGVIVAYYCVAGTVYLMNHA